jgi:predicted PurR-regulated permease PerM
MTLKAVDNRRDSAAPGPVPPKASAAEPEPPRADPAAGTTAAAPVAAAAPTPSGADVPATQTKVDVRSAALTVLAVVATILVLQYAQSMIIPIVLGVLISYALEPVVAQMTRWHIPRALSAAVVLLALTGALGWLLYGLRFEARAIVDQLPGAARRLREIVENDRPTTAVAIEQVQKAATELEKAATAAAPAPPPSGVQRVQVEPPPFNVGDYVVWGSIGIATAVGQFVLILFLVYFLLASGDLYRRKLVKIAGPSLSEKRITVQILLEIDRQIERFLLVQVFTSTVVAVATWLTFRALGLQQAGVWGVLAGVFNSIPYFGPVLVTGGTAVVAFVQFGTIEMTLVVSGLSLLITSLEGFLLTPWLTSKAARMNAVAIFVGLLFWGWVWNVWGMLLAVPMLMVMKVFCDHVEDFNAFGELLGD